MKLQERAPRISQDTELTGRFFLSVLSVSPWCTELISQWDRILNVPGSGKAILVRCTVQPADQTQADDPLPQLVTNQLTLPPQPFNGLGIPALQGFAILLQQAGKLIETLDNLFGVIDQDARP